MATVTGYTAQRMKVIEDTTVVDGHISGNDLILVTRGTDVADITAGDVRGPKGDKGDVGEVSQAELDAAIASIYATGMMMMFAGPTIPTNWLLCDGSAIDRTTYAKLFGVIGLRYGTGNGTTTFNIPNLTFKVPVGIGTSAPNNALGYSSGFATHQLTWNEMPQHTHDMTHNHSVGSNGNGKSGQESAVHVHTYDKFEYLGGGGQAGGTLGTDWGNHQSFTQGQHVNHDHSVDVNYHNGATQAAGQNIAHNNMQPYLIVNYIIHI